MRGIRSVEHFLVKKRIFNRLYREIMQMKENRGLLDHQRVIDAWNMSDELIRFCDTSCVSSFERDVVQRSIIDKRTVLWELLSSKEKVRLLVRNDDGRKRNIAEKNKMRFM